MGIGDDDTSWEAKIPEVQSGMNGTIHATTKLAPSELLYGVRPRLKYDISLFTENQTDKQGRTV